MVAAVHPQPTRTWIFVRHGQSEANLGGWYSGHQDVPLTAKGRRQAAATQATILALHPTAAYSSDLQRASDTARLLLRGTALPLQESPALRERACGVFDGTPISALRLAGVLDRFRDFRWRPDGGESLAEVGLRATAYLSELEGQDAPDVTLIVAHGALIRTLVGLADGTPEAQIGLFEPQNCEALIRALPADAWTRIHDTLRASLSHA